MCLIFLVQAFVQSCVQGLIHGLINSLIHHISSRNNESGDVYEMKAGAWCYQSFSLCRGSFNHGHVVDFAVKYTRAKFPTRPILSSGIYGHADMADKMNRTVV